jgi:hypothetical protein
VNSRIEYNLQKQEGIFIRCECGFEILLVSNLKMMAKAIENHASQHGEREKDPAKAASEQQRIEIDLITQTLKAAAGVTEK